MCTCEKEICNREAARMVAILRAQASRQPQGARTVKLLIGNSELLYRTKKIRR